MKVVGLITEYNPFHNGHKYHIEQAKRLTGADYVIAVMSGNFVQRGTPALIDKYNRTEMALYNGVDLIFELPVCYATGSAEFFAHGAVSLLGKLGIVDYLCFGSECGDIALLQKAAQLILNPSVSFDDSLQTFLKDGLTYPAARLKALKHSIELLHPDDGQALTEVLTEPNNILGIEYLKAIHNLSATMLPLTIKRTSANYHDNTLSDHTISSATAIRNSILNTMNQQAVSLVMNKSRDTSVSFQELSNSIPTDVYRLLKEQYLKTYPITEEAFSQIIKYKILSEDNRTLSSYMDISEDLADRIKNVSDLNMSIRELTGKIKTKNLTLTRINRALIHLLLNIQKEAFTEYNAHGYSQYARVLGIRKTASHLLRKIEERGNLPVITKVSKAAHQLDALGLRMLSEDIFASHLYNQVVYEKYQSVLPNEYKRGIVLL